MTTKTETKAKIAFSATINRDPLLAAVARARNVVEKRGTIPILKNIRLACPEPGRLVVTGTDNDIEISESVACECFGETTVDAEALAGLVQRLPAGGEVSLTWGEDPRLILKCGRSTYRLPVLPASDFPCMPTDDLSPPIELDTDLFAGLIDKTAFAMSTDAARYYLQGVFLHQVVGGETGVLRCTATNGHQLGLANMPAPEGGLPANVIIPTKTIREVVRVLGIAGETVTIAVSKTRIQLVAGGVTLTSRVIDGQFPDYERVIPQENPHVARIDRAMLKACAERVLVLARDRAGSIHLEIAPGKATLTLKNVESGQGTEELEVEYAGPELKIGFNGHYLLDILGRIEAEAAEFHLGESGGTAVVIKDPLNATTLFVIMPMRV